MHGLTASPIRGPAGNVEFLAWLRADGEPPPADQLIEAALREAHRPADPGNTLE
jgi:23S rRNA (cytidine1920-2'-O)/16S rRNA (cytidine1409-2'-O)-methyltransferase